MKELMIMYHPVKKEIRFLAKVKGKFLDVPFKMCPNLQKYSPENGEFLLQNQGNQFFTDIWDQFSHDIISLVFKGTKVDYEDFVEKITEYNKSVGEDRILIKSFVELPPVDEIYTQISEFCDETLSLFETELQDSDNRGLFQKRKEEFQNKRKKLNCNDINLCLVGTYSSGKSTFINTLIGKRILPESINSETAKMFRIQNDENPGIVFTIKKKDNDNAITANINWDAATGRYTFSSTGECEKIRKVIQNEINSAVVFHMQQHEQLYQILKSLNNVPNEPTEDFVEYVDGVIEVHFPIPLDPNISFTFYDTPGTDSNSNEHLLVLRKALQQQTNSILIILYEPTKMEGTGNSVLYKLINSSRNNADANGDVHIDLSRSLHIINQADTRSLTDLSNLRNKKVEVSLKETDKIYNEENECIDLANERLFFVSAKAAYISKAIKNNVDTEDERIWLANHRNEINNVHVDDPLLMKCDSAEVDTGMYFKLNKLANADDETKQMIADCMKELEALDETDDRSLQTILRRVYINSGMYAIEREIVKYAQKYALAVKAKGLYDGISNVVKFIRDDYEAIEAQASLSKQQITENIETMKTTMVKDIDTSYAGYLFSLGPEALMSDFHEVRALNAAVEERKSQAEKIADKMKWIALRPEVFEEKNNIICSELNRYLIEIDDFYKQNRGIILKQQIEDLRNIIVKQITGYKGIDEGLVKRIANVSDTQVPPSTLEALKMDEYINKQKAIFIFSTTDKKSYKNDICEAFDNATRMQYESYIAEILEVAKTKSAELIREFKENIDMISSNLEYLINDEKEAISKHAKAKAVLDMIDKRDEELNKRIWGNE